MNPVRSKKPEIPANSLKTNWTSNGMKIALPVAFLFLTTYFLLPTTVSASTIARPMANSGLVGYWSMEEGTGNSRTFDRSGNGNTGTLTNMDPLTDWVNGATSTGQALDFDGSDDYVDVGTVSALNFERSDSFSLSSWISMDTLPAFQYRFVGRQSETASYNRGYILEIDSTGNFHFSLQSDSNPANLLRVKTSSTFTSLGVFYNVVVTYNGSSAPSGVHIYVNGVDQALTTVTNSLTTSTQDAAVPFHIGNRDSATGGSVMNGKIDEVRIYNRALTSSEVERLYKLQKPKVASGVDNTGLVGYWAFEEGVGTRAEDSSDNNNTGTLTTMDNSDWVTGKVGGALDFDGSSDFVDVGNNASLVTANAFTISFWVYFNSVSGSIFLLSKEGTNPSDNWYSMLKRGSGAGDVFGYAIDIAGTETTHSCTTVPVVNRWYYLTVTWDGANGRCFVNGIQETTAAKTGTMGNNGTPVTIGSYNSGASSFLNGRIDEVRIYNRALTATEVYNLYKGSKASVVNKTKTNRLTNGLVGYWTFDGKDIYTTTAIDRSGSGNNGTLTNGPVPALGKIGQALSFDGSNDYVDVGTMSGIDVSTVTYSAWIYPINTTNGHVMYTGNGATIHTRLSKKGNPPRVEFDYVWSTSICKSATTNGTVPVNTWTHVVVTYDRSLACSASYGPSIYLNGVLKSSADTRTGSGGALTGTNRVTMGSSLVPDEYFPGRIDDVRIYNRILTADEVYQLYNMGR